MTGVTENNNTSKINTMQRPCPAQTGKREEEGLREDKKLPLASSHLIHCATRSYGILRMYASASSLKKLFNVPRICAEVEAWMKLSLVSRAETGRARGSGEGGGCEAGTIL